MLVDEILADTKMPVMYPGFDMIQGILRRASKYVLAPDFTTAADGLTNNYKELERIAPFCRLPAPICWFELAQADRPEFLKAPMHFAELQGAPKRVGFLCIAPDPLKLWHWMTMLMWMLTSEPRAHLQLPGLRTKNNVSQLVLLYDTKDGFTQDPLSRLAGLVEIRIAPFVPPSLKDLLKDPNHQLFKLCQADWSGEIRYLFSVLGLFNARNVVEVERVDKTKHNKARAKHGNPPLCSHTILKIRAMHRRSFLGVRGEGSHGDVRRNFCSGHWKNRRTGLFWWNPHWRGNPQRGTITHDYLVET
jgi:hypothetical protein